MDIVTSNFLPGDPRLIDQIVYELKSQGIFDQFRKECIADVDTKPAYQNLSQRVEGSVMNFLGKQQFSENMNKNQLREQLRKNISESGFLETGVERIVDQVVNPKINTIFLPKVEDVVYRYLGIEKPNQEAKKDLKANVVHLLPNDLEAVSPESVHDHSLNSSSEKKDESIEMNENSLNSSNTKTEDESPPFELLEENTKFSLNEENSVDSHLSGISGLASHESGHSTEVKDENPMDISQDISQNSLNSVGNLSIIVTSDEDINMEICEDSNLSDNRELKETSGNNDNDESIQSKTKEEKYINVDETDAKKKALETFEEKTEEFKISNEMKMDEKKEDSKRLEDKKANENRNDPKKNHEKHKSSRSNKDKKDDKDKKSRSKSENRSKDHKDYKTHSKHSSSSKDKDIEKDKKDYINGKVKKDGIEKDKQIKKEDKERDKSKDKSSKSKGKSDKDRDRSEKDRDKVAKDKEKSDKERMNKDKSDKDKSEKNKEKSDKEKNRPEKSKSDREKDKVDKDKSDKVKPEKEKVSSSKHKEKASSSLKKDGLSKEKGKSEDKSSGDKNSSSKDKTSSSSNKQKESFNKDKDHSKTSKDKDRSKSGSTGLKNKDHEKKGSGDSKNRSSDKHKKTDKDKSSHHDKSNSSFKKDKDKKAVDDHYSIKDKKSERRSTDRDSNDGSSKMSRNGSFTESYSQSFKDSSKESSEVFSSGSGDSNSDKVEEVSIEKAKDVGNDEIVNAVAPQTIKYIKPKFASNIHEAMKIMKIRKQLAKLERQNQLSLTHVQVKDSQSEPNTDRNLKGLSIVLENTPLVPTLTTNQPESANNNEKLFLSFGQKSNKKEPGVSSDKKMIKDSEPEPLSKIIIDKSADTKGTEAFNSKDLGTPLIMRGQDHIAEKSPMLKNQDMTEASQMLKSQDLSMESFEALEARLAQEMSNINCHMYGGEDDIDEYASVSFSPVKKMTYSDERKSSIKKITFDTSNENVDGDKEIELVVDKQVKEPLEEKGVLKNNANKQIIVSNSPEHHYDTSEQVELHRKKVDVLPNYSNIIIENGEELVIDEVHEECVDLIQETTINDIFDTENIDIAQNTRGPEEYVECIQETDLPNINKKYDIEAEVKLDPNVGVKLNESNDEFKGFDDVDRDNTNVIKLTEKISEWKSTLSGKLRNGIKRPIGEHKILEFPTELEIEKIESTKKKNRTIGKHGLSLEATLKEMTNMTSAIQELLQKNGKKLFIKVDKLEHKLPLKGLVSLQGMETNQIVNSPVFKVNAVGMTNQKGIQKEFKGCNEEANSKESLVFNGEETNQNGKIFKEPLNATRRVILPDSNQNGFVEENDYILGDLNWADDDGPCYYFNHSDSHNERHLKILHDRIGKLEKAVEKQSLQIHNNIPSVKKRGRKRKAQSTDNNNSINALCKPEPKRKHLIDATTNQNGGSMCNANVSQNQSFSLPLSPADSEKSEEHKKEEPVTVKTKRTGRVSNTKRYSSEDLYKPRPVLSCSSRRRSAKLDPKP